jgi:hypothetical protein
MIHALRLERTATGVAGILFGLAGCATPDRPSGRTTQPLVESGAPVEGSVLAQLASELPAWIVEPSTLPVGRTGKNDCTFPFGQDVPQWDFHPDAGCWEHAGPDGWTRQQFERIHIPSLPSCGGGPGDGNGIRVCRVGGEGQPSPCFLSPSTGRTAALDVSAILCAIRPLHPQRSGRPSTISWRHARTSIVLTLALGMREAISVASFMSLASIR